MVHTRLPRNHNWHRSNCSTFTPQLGSRCRTPLSL